MLTLRLLSFLFGSLFFLQAPLQSAPRWIRSGPSTEQKVALTFDDGPKPNFTPKILDILKKYKAKATFFVVGRDCLLHPELVSRIHNEGHDLGNHSFTHLRLDTLTATQVRLELSGTNDIIRDITGETTHYFRPPGGRYNDIVLSEANAQNMIMSMWNVNAGDFHFADFAGSNPSKQALNQAAHTLKLRLANQIKPGAIVLLHNGGEETILALPNLIQELQAKGYQFVTLTELIKTP